MTQAQKWNVDKLEAWQSKTRQAITPFRIQLGSNRWQSGAQATGHNVRESTAPSFHIMRSGRSPSVVCEVLLLSNTFPEFCLSQHWVVVSVR
jgi:hypothetical protein